MPGYPCTSIAGLLFLVLVVAGMAISGWQSSPYFCHKTDFLVVVIGIPLIALLLTIGWMLAKAKVAASLDGRLRPVWSDDGPTYPLVAQSTPPGGQTGPIYQPAGPEGNRYAH
jgi:L-asparagine permease